MKVITMLALSALWLGAGATGSHAQAPKGVKEVTLTAREVPLTLASGKVMKAWA